MLKTTVHMLMATLFLCSFARAEMVNFSIDKSIYAGLTQSQQRAITSKASELDQFFKEQVFPKIPAAIMEKIKDLKVTITFADKSGRDGLFVPGIEDHHHKIIVKLIQLNSNGLKSLLTHEFFHAVHFEVNPDEEPWMREGMAQLFEYVVTDELSGLNLQASIKNPYTPLIGEYNIDNANPAQYGHDLLYFYYLYKHCGEDSLLWDIVQGQNELKGAALIDSVLKNKKSNSTECHDFFSSAVSFEAAKLHNQVQLSKDEDRDRFFLAPTNLTAKAMEFSSLKELLQAVEELDDFSSLKIKLDDYNEAKSHLRNCKVFFVRRSFPYDVTEENQAGSLKNLEVILVKTPTPAVLTEVSSKNAGK